MKLSDVFSEKPECAGREAREMRCYDLLEQLSIPYLRIDHDEAMTMEACAEIDERLGVRMCKNLFLTNKQHTCFYLLLIPGDKPFRTAEFSKQVGSSRLSFGEREEMFNLLGIYPGSVTLLGLMNDKDGKVNLCVDADLLDEEYIGMHPCVNTSSVRIKTRDAFGKLTSAMKHDITVVHLEGGKTLA